MISSGLAKQAEALFLRHPLQVGAALLVLGAGVGAFAPGAYHQVSAPQAVQAPAYDPQLTVYRTGRGRCFHLPGCMALHSQGIPLKLIDVGRLRPCSICNPPYDPKTTEPLRKPRVSTRVPREPRY